MNVEVGIGVMGPQSKEYNGHQKLEEVRNGCSPEASKGTNNPTDFLIVASGLQNWKRINLCCFKPQFCGSLLQQPQEINIPAQPQFPYLLNRNKICALLGCFDKINKCKILAQSLGTW